MTAHSPRDTLWSYGIPILDIAGSDRRHTWEDDSTWKRSGRLDQHRSSGCRRGVFWRLGWRYRFEAYVPEARRERGYYAMPLLWQEDVIGWANAKIDGERLNVGIGTVGKRPRAKAFRSAVEAEVEAMTTFLGLESGSWELEWQ